MLTNQSRVVLYIGMTNELENRMQWHWNTEKFAFVKRYNLDRLVYYEEYADVRDAIAREKQLKRWRRGKKNDLVRRLNPNGRTCTFECLAQACEIPRSDAGGHIARDDNLRGVTITL